MGTIISDNEYDTVRILKISDLSDSEIIIPIFFDLDQRIKEGDTIAVSGKVELYRETLEVVPSNSRDIKKLG